MADVTIRGAGIFGLSIAWACLSRGAKVRVVDPYGPGAGSSGGVVGALAPHVPENWNSKKAFQFDSLIMAEGFWRGVEAAGGISSGYGRTGRLQPIADAHALELAQGRAETAVDLWQGHATWEVIPAAKAGGWAPHSPSGFLIHDTLTARLHPRRACAALVAAITAKGGEIVPEATDEGRMLWATGIADLETINTIRPRMFGAGVKGQGASLKVDMELTFAPQLFADTVHIVPHADGTIAIGSTSERDYDDPKSTDNQLDIVIERALAAVPALKGAEVVDRWAGVRPRSRSRAPVLGDHPIHRGQYIANGGFKIGFGMAPKVAEVMTDLLLEDVDQIPEDFRPEASF
ncbi:FAD-binding oxidoreductase [Thalassobius sp. Cn5-15]|uniref:NAD(P)/FAD-dependent oxidoreductase n=1 Tax=Thalassobius sp. Cn5-15 TaxID=2917763 RepID=UPI001EF257D2|nr:FAD-dependent oxidoreductase [Thalassobius sp. Cn5-15]MCG7494549.1 FAD-binding oxidoreductase [Thalassobius sp. Cn5-15]